MPARDGTYWLSGLLPVVLMAALLFGKRGHLWAEAAVA
jgi:hypothetical protein